MKKKFLIFLLFSTLLYGEKLELFFDGNVKISSSELYGSLDLYEPSFYEFYIENPSIEPKTIDLITQTIKDYYKTKGFFHADVIYLKNDKFITIKIEEKSPIIVKNISNISDLDLSKNIPFKVGDIFDATKFTQSKKEIRLLYANKSFCNASIDAKAWIDIELNEAYLKYESAQNKLRAIGINPDVFAYRICSNNCEGLSKQDGSAFRYASEKTGVPAENHVYIGNSTKSDIMPAKAVGMQTIGVWSDIPEADTSVMHIHDLKSLLL